MMQTALSIFGIISGVVLIAVALIGLLQPYFFRREARKRQKMMQNAKIYEFPVKIDRKAKNAL